MDRPDHTNHIERADTRTTRRVSRATGAAGLAFLVLAFLSQNPPFYSDAGNGSILHWVQAHPTALYVEGARTAYMMILMVGFLAALVWRTGLRGTLRSGVWALLGASLAIDMVWSGVYYALAYAGQHDIGDSGVLALAYLTEQLTFTDGLLWGIAVLIICVAGLRSTHPARTGRMAGRRDRGRQTGGTGGAGRAEPHFRRPHRPPGHGAAGVLDAGRLVDAADPTERAESSA